MTGTYSSYPKLVMIEITNKCNLTCDYCFRSRADLSVKEIPWEVFLNLKDGLKFVEDVSFCGMGEQLLHPGYYDMIAALEDKNVLVITNGTIPIDYERLFAKNNIDSITFSVDGPTEEIARKSCVKYNFKNLVDNLVWGSKFTGVPKGINYVLSPDNLAYAPQMVEFAAQYQVKSLNLLLPSYNPRWVAKNSAEIGIILDKSYDLANKLGVSLRDPYHRYCVYKHSVIPFITIAGDLRPCCDHFYRIPMAGSLLKKNFEEIWNGPVYQKFRTGIYCSDCSMYKKISPKKSETVEDVV